MKKEKPSASALICTTIVFAVLFSLTVLTSVLTVRNLGAVILHFGEEQFGTIFSQISDARLILPLYLPFFICLAFALLAAFTDLSKRRAGKLAGLVILGLFLFIAVTLLTVWLTSVNGIRISDVALSLLRYLKNGLADSL